MFALGLPFCCCCVLLVWFGFAVFLFSPNADHLTSPLSFRFHCVWDGFMEQEEKGGTCEQNTQKKKKK